MASSMGLAIASLLLRMFHFFDRLIVMVDAHLCTGPSYAFQLVVKYYRVSDPRGLWHSLVVSWACHLFHF